MSKNTDDIYRKISKWTDSIKKDIKYFGVGTVNNQTHLANGVRIDKPSEDRSFSYEFKENAIYAYGLLDGYNGNWAVDIVDQYILSNVYFDHLESLEKRNDEEIFEILRNEFLKTEKTLEEHMNDILLKIASINVELDDIRRGTPEYQANQRELKFLNNQINSGVLGLVTLIVDDRLFVCNVGQINCFVCFVDRNNRNKLKVVSLQTDHTTSNCQEVLRLVKLKADITDLESLETEDNLAIKYTRCLGDFKAKAHYRDYDMFKSCVTSPITAMPDHPSKSLIIDDSYLFMCIYSDAIGQAIRETDPDTSNIDIKITEKLINKIINEQTLNSAAQSVLDEIKRSYDDKFITSYSERGDFTLLVRAFDPSLKNRLIQIKNREDYPVLFTDYTVNTNNTNDNTVNSNMSGTNVSDDNNQSSSPDPMIEKIAALIDEEGKVIPYVDVDLLNSLIESDEQFKQLTKDLKALEFDLESTEIETTTRI